MNKNQNRNQNQNGNRNKNKNQNQALNRNLKYTIPAVLILILELLMLFAPVFSGATALVLLRSLWLTGSTGTRILCAVCLAACPAAAVFAVTATKTGYPCRKTPRCAATARTPRPALRAIW